uniref:Putative secreted protein n=1 Tax=Ixodes ricinus TaxID=34613 RepID=A0A6B0UXG2_IXORI
MRYWSLQAFLAACTALVMSGMCVLVTSVGIQDVRSPSVNRSMSLSVTSHKLATTQGLPPSQYCRTTPQGSILGPDTLRRPLPQPMRMGHARHSICSIRSPLRYSRPEPWPQYKITSFPAMAAWNSSFCGGCPITPGQPCPLKTFSNWAWVLGMSLLGFRMK